MLSTTHLCVVQRQCTEGADQGITDAAGWNGEIERESPPQPSQVASLANLSKPSDPQNHELVSNKKRKVTTASKSRKKQSGEMRSLKQTMQSLNHIGSSLLIVRHLLHQIALLRLQSSYGQDESMKSHQEYAHALERIQQHVLGIS